MRRTPNRVLAEAYGQVNANQIVQQIISMLNQSGEATRAQVIPALIAQLHDLEKYDQAERAHTKTHGIDMDLRPMTERRAPRQKS